MKIRKAAIAIILIMLVLSAGLWTIAGTTGIISGVVKSEETGTPLEGANVIINGTNLSTVTDSNGHFTITNVPPGEYNVQAELVGYGNETVKDVQVTMDSTATLEFGMKQEVAQEESAVVTRPKPMVSSDVVNTLTLVTNQQEDLTRLDPANIRAASGVLSAYPGVIVDTDGSGQMHIRGGRANQSGWYLEGIPITDPNTGMFGTNLYTTGMSKFQVYTGGFGAEYGNAIAGVMNEVKKTGAANPGYKLNLEHGSDTYWNSFGEVGGGTADSFNYYVGVAALSSDIDGPLVKEQDYVDGVAKLVWPMKNDNVTVLAMRGTLNGHPDAYHDTGDNGVATPHEKDFMTQKYSVNAVTWSHNFTPKSFVTVRPYLLDTNIVQNIVGAYGTYAKIWSTRKGLQLQYTNQLNERHLLKFGDDFISSNNYYYVYPGFPYYHSDVDTTQNSIFAEDQVKLGEKLTGSVGLRRESITYDRTGRAYVEGAGYTGNELSNVTETKTSPRLSLSYAADERTVWKTSWGKYVKFTPAYVVQREYTDPDLVLGEGYPTLEQMTASLGSTVPQTSDTFEVSLEKQISDSVAYRVTPFYSKYHHLNDLYTDPDTYLSTYTDLGEGKSSGVEFYVRKKMTNNWQSWLSYTYQKTKANRADLGMVSDMYYTSWDQRHTLSLVTDYNAGKFTHNLRADYGSGRADIGEPSLQQHANPYVILSYGMTYQLPENSDLGKSIYLNIYNLFNNRQTTQYEWDGSTRVSDYWIPGRTVSVGVAKEF